MFRAVIDTNILVSAILRRASIPARILDRVWQRELVPVYSTGFLDEYREVLSRPKFGFPIADVRCLIEDLAGLGQQVEVTDPPPENCPDPKDWPVIATALEGHCLAITGTIKHFPSETGVTALTPREFLEHFLRGE